MLDSGRIVVISGASQSGKTSYTMRAVKAAKRVLAWDAHDQWGRLPGWRRISSLAELRDVVHDAGPMRVAFYPMARGSKRDLFEAFATAARYWLLYSGPGVIIAEELGDSSSSGKASERWGELLRQALKLGGTIYAIAQRWAEADKTAFGNSSEIVCFRLSRAVDRAYMAKEMDVPVTDIEALVPKLGTDGKPIALPYIRVTSTREIERGEIRFKRKA